MLDYDEEEDIIAPHVPTPSAAEGVASLMRDIIAARAVINHRIKSSEPGEVGKLVKEMIAAFAQAVSIDIERLSDPGNYYPGWKEAVLAAAIVAKHNDFRHPCIDTHQQWWFPSLALELEFHFTVIVAVLCEDSMSMEISSIIAKDQCGGKLVCKCNRLLTLTYIKPHTRLAGWSCPIHRCIKSENAAIATNICSECSNAAPWFQSFHVTPLCRECLIARM